MVYDSPHDLKIARNTRVHVVKVVLSILSKHVSKDIVERVERECNSFVFTDQIEQRPV